MKRVYQNIFIFSFFFFIPKVAKADLSDEDFFNGLLVFLAIFSIPTILATILSIIFLTKNRSNLKSATMYNFFVLVVNIWLCYMMQGATWNMYVFYLVIPTIIVFVITLVSYLVMEVKKYNL